MRPCGFDVAGSCIFGPVLRRARGGVEGTILILKKYNDPLLYNSVEAWYTSTLYLICTRYVR